MSAPMATESATESTEQTTISTEATANNEAVNQPQAEVRESSSPAQDTGASTDEKPSNLEESTDEKPSNLEDNMTASQLLDAGQALFDSKDYSEGCLEFFSKALEKKVNECGANHFDCAKFYTAYSRTALRCSMAEADVLAKIEKLQQEGPSKKKVEVGEAAGAAPEAAPEAALEVAPESGSAPTDTVEDSTSTPAADAEEKLPEGGAGAGDECAVKAGKMEAVVVPAKPTEFAAVDPSASNTEDAMQDGNLVDTRQLAWELAEMARLIHVKQAEPNVEKLFDVHMLLGDIAMEDGNFARSYKEYVEATKVLGKDVSESDRRLASAHQMAGLCSLYDQQTEAAVFHYTAAAECFNNLLTEILVKHGVIEKPAESGEMIEFADQDDLEKLKQKLGDEHADCKAADELNALVGSLIERVNEIQNQEDEDAKNPDLQNVVKGLAMKLAKTVSSQMMKGMEGGETATSATAISASGAEKQTGDDATGITTSGFDKGSSNADSEPTAVNVLVPKRRARPEQDGEPSSASKRRKCDNEA